MKYSYLLLIPLLFACTEGEREQAQQEQYEMQLRQQLIETTEPFRDDLTLLLGHYFNLKDTLVATNPEAAGELAVSLVQAAEAVDVAELNDETVMIWASFADEIVSHGTQLRDQSDVEEQRVHFEDLSETMIQIIDSFRPAGYEIFVQSCPMVRDGSAEWLSREEEIRNPYHGDRMLHCGEILRRI